MDEKRIELLKAMGYSDLAIRFILEKTNVGQIEKPSIYAKEQGTCGDIMILTILIRKNIIKDAKYDYIGCAGLQAAASALTEMIKEKKFEDIKNLKAQDVLNYLGGLPEQKHECAQLACNTLKKGIYEYHNGVSI